MVAKKEMINAAWAVLNFNKIILDQDKFAEWVNRKANSLYKRDKKRTKGDFKYTPSQYVEGICKAIEMNPVFDCYTGDKLDWDKIGRYDNQKAEANGAEYKKEFAEMPTVDHLEAKPIPDFRICTWRTNDAKNDLSLREFKDLCRKVLTYKDTNILGK